ncbi:MAG: hypothetical protein NTW67_02630, partial [Candidatus Woesearchaeota archaeon]|nr:hypothetical protein [Candidatus Woesearchaeota archaeon]
MKKGVVVLLVVFGFIVLFSMLFVLYKPLTSVLVVNETAIEPSVLVPVVNETSVFVVNETLSEPLVPVVNESVVSDTLPIYEGENTVAGGSISVGFERLIREVRVFEGVKRTFARPGVVITNPGRAEFKSVAGYYDGPSPTGMTITTDVLAVESMTVEKAVIQLPKRGRVDKILRCADFDLDAFACAGWEVTDISFSDRGDFVEFKVTSFSGYAGAAVANSNYQVLDGSTAPVINFTFPTPANGSTISVNFSTINVTVNENVSSCILSWDPPTCSALGGNITTDGDYCVHTFYSNGTF